MNAAVGSRPLRGIADQLLQFQRQGVQVTEKTNAHLFRFEGPQLFLQHPFEQGHQEIHLITWPGPVLR